MYIKLIFSALKQATETVNWLHHASFHLIPTHSFIYSSIRQVTMWMKVFRHELLLGNYHEALQAVMDNPHPSKLLHSFSSLYSFLFPHFLYFLIFFRSSFMPLLFHFDFIAFIFYVIFHIFFHFPSFIHSSLSPIFSLCFPFIQPLKITHQKLTLKTSRTATTATITPPSPGEVIVCGSCCWCCVRRRSTPSFHPCPSTTSTQPSKPRCHLL